VCGGRTGHTEAVQLTYRPSEVTYDRLCDAFFAKIDPTQVRAAVHPPGWF
jgi:peptide-methionine (S)-S-oxide reductase